MNFSFGYKEESVYGTPVTVDRHIPLTEDGLDLVPGIVDGSDENRAGAYGERTDQNAPVNMGTAGTIGGIVPTKGFGLFLKHGLGGHSVGTVTDLNYTQTNVPGTLFGKSFTGQSNRPFHPSGTSKQITWHGCKINSLELAIEVGDFLRWSADIDGEDHDTSTALEAVAYPSISANGAKFPWNLCAVTIGGSSVPVDRFRVGINNNLKTDRRFLNANPLKGEPTRNGKMSVDWDLDIDWADATQYARVAATTIGSRVATIVATFSGAVALAGTTVPQLVITMHDARFDDGGLPAVSSDEPLRQSLSGIAVDDGTNGLITVTYRTTDATA